jgi:hypothetical protein
LVGGKVPAVLGGFLARVAVEQAHVDLWRCVLEGIEVVEVLRAACHEKR